MYVDHVIAVLLRSDALLLVSEDIETKHLVFECHLYQAEAIDLGAPKHFQKIIKREKKADKVQNLDRSCWMLKLGCKHIKHYS